MKIFVAEGMDYVDKLQSGVIKADMRLGGNEIVKFPSNADVVVKMAVEFKEISNKLAHSSNDRETYVVMNNGKENVVFTKSDKETDGLYVRTYKEPTSVKQFVGDKELNVLKQSLIDYIAGKVNEIKLIDPIPFSVIYPMIDIYRAMGSTGSRGETEQKSLMSKWGLDRTQMEIISDEIRMLSRYNSGSEILNIFRHIKMIWTGMAINNKTGLVIPNNSDNILANMTQARLKAIFYSNTTDPVKKKKFSDDYAEKTGNIIKTAKNSLLGTNKGFMTYAKAIQKQLGVYGLFIYDDNLADGEILIPNPRHMNLTSTKSKLVINNVEHEVLFLHARKTIIINGPYADKAMTVYQSGAYSDYTVECNHELDLGIKEYPSIGDEILATRHPITTILGRFKVVGYTDDCSIRVNCKTALAMYADSDGDSLVISWSRWSDKLEFHGVKEIDEFCQVAGIDVDDNVEYESKFDINDFINLTPCSDEENAEKLDKSGMEQADAKLMTAEETGRWGAIERDLVLTLMLNGVSVDMLIVYMKSLLSQVLVQAKNILADLQSGKGLSQEVKDTIVLFSYMVGSPLAAAPAVSKLLNIPESEARNLITELRGDKVVRETEEEIISEEFNDIAYMR